MADSPIQNNPAFDPKSFLERRSQATQNLIGSSRQNKSQGKYASDKLTQVAAKRSADSVRFTQFFLKNRLVKDLDQTMHREFQKHPELKGKVFVGVIVDEGFKAEVIPLDQAAQAVEGMDPEEAMAALEREPVGYFERANFTMQTPGDEKYQSFKQGLEEYFERNREIIDFLRSHPELQVDADDLYTRP